MPNYMHDRNFLIIECRSEKETDQQTMWVRADDEERNETFAFLDELRSIFLSLRLPARVFLRPPVRSAFSMLRQLFL